MPDRGSGEPPGSGAIDRLPSEGCRRNREPARGSMRALARPETCPPTGGKCVQPFQIPGPSSRHSLLAPVPRHRQAARAQSPGRQLGPRRLEQAAAPASMPIIRPSHLELAGTLGSQSLSTRTSNAGGSRGRDPLQYGAADRGPVAAAVAIAVMRHEVGTGTMLPVFVPDRQARNEPGAGSTSCPIGGIRLKPGWILAWSRQPSRLAGKASAGKRR